MSYVTYCIDMFFDITGDVFDIAVLRWPVMVFGFVAVICLGRRMTRAGGV